MQKPAYLVSFAEQFLDFLLILFQSRTWYLFCKYNMPIKKMLA